MPIYRIKPVNESIGTAIAVSATAAMLLSPAIIDLLGMIADKKKLKDKKKKLEKGINAVGISEEDLNKINYAEADNREINLLYEVFKRLNKYVPKYNSILKEIVKDFKNAVPEEKSYKKLKPRIESLLKEVKSEDAEKEYKSIKKNLNKTEQDFNKIKYILKSIKNIEYRLFKYPDEIPDDTTDEWEKYDEYCEIFRYSEASILDLEERLEDLWFIYWYILEDITVKVIKRKK